jgi:hypothetical protein
VICRECAFAFGVQSQDYDRNSSAHRALHNSAVCGIVPLVIADPKRQDGWATAQGPAKAVVAYSFLSRKSKKHLPKFRLFGEIWRNIKEKLAQTPQGRTRWLQILL